MNDLALNSDSAQEDDINYNYLKGEAHVLLDIACQWIQRRQNIADAEALADVVKRLLTLSGDTASDTWINYHFARAAIAQEQKEFHGAMYHCRKALTIASRFYPQDTWLVIVAKINVGECWVALGQKQRGREIIASCLEQFKNCAIGNEPHKISWKEAEVKRIDDFLHGLD